MNHGDYEYVGTVHGSASRFLKALQYNFPKYVYGEIREGNLYVRLRLPMHLRDRQHLLKKWFAQVCVFRWGWEFAYEQRRELYGSTNS